ncbi:MAG: hypothetical protein JWQ38_371 [Flavipsychrobacter sp.]|nr:hypothetical protein [Flavipsychrobacter sp.]
MAERKRHVAGKKMPAFKMTRQEEEEQDLKKVKEEAIKALEEDQANKKDWYDKELDKNLKKQ